MSRWQISFIATEQSENILSALPKGKKSKFINEAIAAYRAMLDVNDKSPKNPHARIALLEAQVLELQVKVSELIEGQPKI